MENSKDDKDSLFSSKHSASDEITIKSIVDLLKVFKVDMVTKPHLNNKS